MLGNEQRPHAVTRSPSLEEIVAERLAGEAARIAEDLIREAFSVTEFDPDEVYGFMNSEEAAEFLGVSPTPASARSPPPCPATRSRRRGSDT